MSPALSYSSKHLHGDVDKEKKEKLPKELEEDKIKREEEKQGIYADKRWSVLSSLCMSTGVESLSLVSMSRS